VHSFSLDGLDEKERNVLAPQRLLERVQVAVRNAVEAGEQRPETTG